MTRYKVISPTADVRGQPDDQALRGKIESQLAYGEIFIGEEEKDGWIKGTCAHDNYPGYIDKQYLTREFSAATHVVTAQRSHIYRDADMKSPLLSTLGFGSQLTVIEQGEKFAKLETGEWIFARHIAPLSAREDFVEAALRLVETPYVWGGRTGLGMDCSGLVQMALARAGVSAPRDTNQQEGVIGYDVTQQPRQRGDIVYFPGHVGIMIDEKNILHANAFHMKTTIEPLQTVAARSDSKITAVRRI